MLRRSACLAAAGLALLAAPAYGAEVLSTNLSAPTSAKRTCHANLLTGGAGYVQRQVTAPATGVISARLNGAAGGDWDLGVFDATGRTVAGSAHFGNRELAEGIATQGQRLTVQACRRSGSVGTVQLRVAGWALPVATGDNRVQLVRVPTPTSADKDRLLATGLDVTEHGSATYLDTVLHGADDVGTLTANGFGYQVVIPDLVRHDRAALRLSHTSSSPAPAMPSGRTNYRRLPDYSADMKRLAEPHPDLVRPITLPYLSLEGRPIEGIEITSNPTRVTASPCSCRWACTTPASGPRASTPSSGRTSSSTTTAWTSGPPISSTGRERSSSRSSTRTASTSRARSRSRTRPSTRSRARCRSTRGSRWSTPASPTSGATAAWCSSTRAKAATRRARAPARRRRTAPTASTRTETTAASGAGPGRAPTRPATPSGARGRSRSPRPGTCSGWSPTAR